MTYAADIPNIALLGRAGAGKDTVAQVLIERFGLGYRRAALADPLKDIASLIWGNDARTDRTKLQGLGVAVRDIQADSWVQLLMRHIRRTDGERPSSAPPIRWVVTDVRFPNELTALKAAGFISIRVCADTQKRIDRLTLNGKLQDPEQLNHVSETALDDATTDYVLWNNSTHDEVERCLTDILNGVRR